MRKIADHWKIIIGIGFGILSGALIVQFGAEGKSFAINWIKPWGIMFMNSLKLIAVPLIFTSLVKGISDLKDMGSFSKIGKRTFIWYIITTFIAIAVGLIVVNLIRPGLFVSEDTRTKLITDYTSSSDNEIEHTNTVYSGPLSPLVNIVPDNIFDAASSNANMLQVIFFALLFGSALLIITDKRKSVVKQFFDDCNEIILRIVGMIMYVTPFGVFSLMTLLIVEAPSSDIFIALGVYGLTVIIGLGLLLYVIYPVLVKYLGGTSPLTFIRAMIPAQLIAFSTSSAAASLPVTLKCVQEGLKIRPEVSNFTIPVGATINMDGTTLYQTVAAIFIVQVTGHHLDFSTQITLIFTAALAGFGAAAVPGAGIMTLIIVLEAINVNPAAIALIVAIDRPLDMLRTVVNVTGDGMISLIVDKQIPIDKLNP